MSARRLLIACFASCSLLVVLGCNNGDKYGPLGVETRCTDGVDNDSDGAADCLDVDCAAHADCESCGNGICEVWEYSIPRCIPDCGSGSPICGDGKCQGDENRENCFRDCGVAVCDDGACEGDETELSCPQDCARCDEHRDLWEQVGCPGEACTLVGQGEAGCAPVGTNAFYADCSNDAGCLPGAFCAGDGSFERCLPFCDLSDPTVPTCPGDGFCVWTLDLTAQPIGAEIGLCDIPIFECDPVANTGCTAPEQCFIEDGRGTTCLRPTTNPSIPAMPCDQDRLNGCVAGASCIATPVLRCYEACYLSDGTGCDYFGTCQDVANNPLYGVCQ